jgi:hypothetical protein
MASCADKRKVVVEFWLYLTAAFTVIRRLTGKPSRGRANGTAGAAGS